MKSNEVKLSAYKITWIEFRAVKGIVTKKDAKILLKLPSPMYRHGDRVHEHFGSMEAALKYLESKNFSKLSKQYEVRIFTDKQYSLATVENGITVIPFTSKQNEEMFIIGKYGE